MEGFIVIFILTLYLLQMYVVYFTAKWMLKGKYSYNGCIIMVIGIVPTITTFLILYTYKKVKTLTPVKYLMKERTLK